MTSQRENELQELRRWLDDYGTTAESRRRTWEEVLDDYDNALADVATEHGLTLPDAPERIQRRFTSNDRETLERQVEQFGIRLRL